jgi:hypothetical protein
LSSEDAYFIYQMSLAQGASGDEGAPGFNIQKRPVPPRKNNLTGQQKPPTTDDLPKTPYKETLSIQPTYKTEHITPHPDLDRTRVVDYLPVEALPKYEVHVRDGRLYNNTGSLIDGNGIYVMAPSGRIYYAPESIAKKGAFHHSSFFAGGDVAAAGEIRVKNGFIQTISRGSGHYLSEPKNLEQFKSELKRRGVGGWDQIVELFQF